MDQKTEQISRPSVIPVKDEEAANALAMRSRRNFLKHGSVLAGTALASTALGAGAARAQSATKMLEVPETMKMQGREIGTTSYGMPSEHEKDVVRRVTDVFKNPQAHSSWSMTPLQDLHGIITPNGLVFERHHNGIADIDPDEHRLAIHGMVRQPLILTMDELMRFPSVSRIHFLECSGNGLTEWAKPRSVTVQQSHGLLSCCEWTGVPLSTLLEEVGVQPGASWVLAEGADASGLLRSIPLQKALDDVLVVYGQNGEALRPEQGYPVRLFVPGYEGNMSIKWLRRIEIGDRPWNVRGETVKYSDLMPDGRHRQFTFVMEAKSVITRPSGGQQLTQKGFNEITGFAWTGQGKITHVDVSVDGGKNWQEARLQEPVLDKCLVRFRFPWVWNGEPAVLQSRATDSTGYVQPRLDQLVAVRGVNSVYHHNGIQSWQVSEKGEVTNVHA